ncbi:hypothetical protein F5146DRAFT_197263 [Armillaria mellea]|nr:hypothetical protein F5146DRAFT_197263 [Armillaria mellea]
MITLHPPFCVVLLAVAAETPRVGSQQHGKTVGSYSDQTTTGTIDFSALWFGSFKTLLMDPGAINISVFPSSFCCGSHHSSDYPGDSSKAVADTPTQVLGFGRPSLSSPTCTLPPSGRLDSCYGSVCLSVPYRSVRWKRVDADWKR